jgi:hypothetical protein
LLNSQKVTFAKFVGLSVALMLIGVVVLLYTSKASLPHWIGQYHLSGWRLFILRWWPLAAIFGTVPILAWVTVFSVNKGWVILTRQVPIPYAIQYPAKPHLDNKQFWAWCGSEAGCREISEYRTRLAKKNMPQEVSQETSV